MNEQLNLSHLMMNTWTMAYRNLLKTVHNPDRFMDVIIQPILFMVMFGYLFGGAIAGGVHAYLPTIVPGILIQTMLSAGSGSGAQLREDLDSGVFNRFRSLPMAHVAPLAGQLLADGLRLLLATLTSLTTGYLMGWRPTVGIKWVLVSAALAIFTGWALSWLFAFLGLLVKSAAAVQSISLMMMLVLSFMSNAFVPLNSLTHPLKIIANLNPVTHVITAIRQILQTENWTPEALIVLVFDVGIIALFVPLTVWAYDRQANS